MKKFLFLTLIVLGGIYASGQGPQPINYQGIARNSVGSVIPNQNITLRLSVRDGSATGTIVYSETRALKTNNNGLFVTAIGAPGGFDIKGSFAGISWSSGTKFLQVEMDITGASQFIDMGTAQLLSVPYALYANAAPPVGNAGGDLVGTYPSPAVKDGAITNSKIADGTISAAKLQPGVIPSSLFPTGAAGGDLTGTYPNPTLNAGAVDNTKLADNAVSTLKIQDASVTSAKLAAGVIPTTLPPSGTAGGDLTGTYPNPTLNAGVVDNIKLADNAVSTVKIQDASVTSAKLAAGVIPTTLPPSGTAGGDLTGTYPNPVVSQLQGVSVSNTAPVSGQVLKFNGSSWVPGADNVGSGGSPTGAAGGDLTGTYPNPTLNAGAVDNTKLADNAVSTLKIQDASVTSAKLAAGVIPTTLPPSGTAGGDLTGTYPNPTLNAGVVNTTKLADNAVSTLKIQDASVTSAKLAAGVIPTSLPPNGSAGGDLSGSYPNPTLDKIKGITISTTAPATGQVLKYDGTQWIPSADIVGSGGSPTGSAGGDLSGNYPNPNIASGAVTSSKIANSAINTPKLADGAVNQNKLADLSVSTLKIQDGAVTAQKLAAGVIPTTLPPSGTAGGDLTGTYPNPVVSQLQGVSVSNTAPVSGQVLKFNGSSWVPGADNVGSGGSPTGAAGGDLTGTYPNPTLNAGVVDNTKLADNAVSTLKIQDASVTSAKLAAGVIPTSLPPNGSAGGDLSGSYPNPTLDKIKGITISTTVPATGQVLKYDGTQWIPSADNVGSGGSPTGAAGGDLTGTYPNPTLNTGVVNTTKLADNAVSTLKIQDASVTSAKLAAGVIPTTLPPSGTAGGDLTGTYPNPVVSQLQGVSVSNTAPVSGQVLKFNGSSWVPGADNVGSGGSPTGAAGGDLTGTYPNPTLNTGVVDNTKLADNAVSTLKIQDASVTSAKLAAGVIPTSLPPNGAAGGDLSSTYPNPVVSKIRGITVANTAPTTGQVLKFDGTQWAPAAESGGGGSLTLPYSSTVSSASNLFSLTNSGSGSGLEGINSTTTSNVSGVIGTISSTSPGTMSAGVKGVNNSLGGNGIGVYGTHAGSGYGVFGNAVSGTGVYGQSATGNAGVFNVTDVTNSTDAVVVNNVGLGNGVNSLSEQGSGVVGMTNSNADQIVGVKGFNTAGGGGIWGVTLGGTGSGIKGTDFAGEGGAAVEGELLSVTTGNLALFKVDGVNMARIDQTGKGFFNGGTQNSGADVAESFDVEGDRTGYEPGDVLVISQSSDRTVEKSQTPYSTLVAGVYATKPGVLLTEKTEQSRVDAMVPMGVIGVLPTKVCLEGGAIKRGDLIVTSSTAGVAMKADPDKVRIGQVIGKALEDYSGSGIGKIKVLVSIK